MKSFEIGQLVRLASNPEIIFKIIQINRDYSFEIQVQSWDSNHLSYNNVPPEMLRKVEN